MARGADRGLVAVKLEIEHVTQQGNNLRGDCGPAVVAMLTGLSIEQALAACELRPHQWATFGHLIRGLRANGIQSTFIRGMRPLEMQGHLLDGRPVVCLVDYGKLPGRLRAENFNGAHFVLLAGMDDDDFLVHDPLQQQGFVRWLATELRHAQWEVPGNSYDYQSLIVHRDYRPAADTAGLLAQARDTIEALRVELERVRGERDAFRQALEACQAARRKLAEKAAQ